MGITNIEKYNQTHIIRPKLKTINGQSLYSGGNIEVGGSSNGLVYVIDDTEYIDDKSVYIYHYGLTDTNLFIINITGYYNNNTNYWANYRQITIPAINGFTSTFYTSDADYTNITITVDDEAIQISTAYTGDVLTINKVYGVRI